jgi:chemotaxis signal transduction protein
MSTCLTEAPAATPPHSPGPAEPGTLACLLGYGGGESVALPLHCGVELVENPRPIPVPGMPVFCLGLLNWQARQLPLIDLQAYLLGGRASGAARASTHALVVAFQDSAATGVAYGALCAPFLVRLTQVHDSQQCALPADNPIWSRLAIACFEDQGRPVPVLDLSRVFARPPSPTPS